MFEVRSIQKRVAMHVHACELDPRFTEDLRETLEALAAKRRCNEKIDAVVAAERSAAEDREALEFEVRSRARDVASARAQWQNSEIPRTTKHRSIMIIQAPAAVTQTSSI